MTEEIWNTITHGLGVVTSIVGAVIILTEHMADSPPHHRTAVTIYCICLCMMFAFSTFYHSFFYHVATSQVFQILDHCGIFIFIAATYTPFALMGCHGPNDTA